MGNNPIMNNDPTGHKCGPEDDCLTPHGGNPSISDPIPPDPNFPNKGKGKGGNGGHNGQGSSSTNPIDSVTNAYMGAWQTFGTAWENDWNPDASLESKIIGNYYMSGWIAGHALLAVAVIAPVAIGDCVESGCSNDAQAAGEIVDGVGGKIITVIGRYPANRDLANSIGGNWLNKSMEVWNSMTPEEQWGANKQWLQEAIIRGDVFRLASKLSEAVPGSGYAKELNYLFENNYTVTLDQQYLVSH